jgi:RNA polymerase-binding transcription factor DksA
MQTTQSDIRQQLETELDKLTQRMTRIDGDLRATHDPDWAERATEIEDDEVLEGLGAAGRVEVAAIRAALTRLDAGTYGACAACGGPIPEPRLKAIPTVATCIECAA